MDSPSFAQSVFTSRLPRFSDSTSRASRRSELEVVLQDSVHTNSRLVQMVFEELSTKQGRIRYSADPNATTNRSSDDREHSTRAPVGEEQARAHRHARCKSSPVEAQIDDSATARRHRAIQDTIYTPESELSFDDIIGLKDVKSVLEEAILLPARMPSVFKGGNQPTGSLEPRVDQATRQ